MERAKPPSDISPDEFFTRWVPEAVAGDPERRRRLGSTAATIVFHLAPSSDADADEPGGVYTLEIDAGCVQGRAGNSEPADLRVDVDVATWRSLNAGELSAPNALLRRRIKLDGDFLLGLKLHLILG